MVVFTCNHCGDSLQKPRVEKHYSTTCSRNPKSLTCVDCHKDFRLEEYAAHTKCITETERYSAKGTVIGAPKGEKKQESWVETVTNVIAEQRNNVSKNIQNVFDLMEKHNNIPRKKKPFLNFLSSASGFRINVKDIEAVWDIIEKHTKPTTQQKAGTNGVNHEDKSKTEENPKDGESTENTEGKKKKNKKSKNKENNLNGTNEEPTKPEEETAENGETKKSKKKRKNKQPEAADTTEEVPEKKIKTEDTEENGEESPKKKKKSKSEANKESVLEDTEKIDAEKSSKKKKRKSQPIENGETNGNQETNDESPKKQKTEENGTEESERFHWEETITEILKKKPDGMKKDKLENKVFKKYEKIKGTIENKGKLVKKYNKKLKLITISSDDELIKLVA